MKYLALMFLSVGLLAQTQISIGRVPTATALASNGANCSAGNFPLGVDASGASESCTPLPTTIAGTANQISASAATGAVVLSIPNNPTLPGTTSGTFSGNVTAPLYSTATNCSSSAAPAVCAAAAAGSVVIAAASTTVTVNTTAVTDNSQIIIQEDSSLGTKLSVTCNTTISRTYAVTARTAATSFVITTSAAPVTNPACLSYIVLN